MNFTAASWRSGVTAVLLGLLTLGDQGCSVKRFVADEAADALSGPSQVLASQDDPQLVREAVPPFLITMESLLVETPKHVGLLTTACSSFTQYGYGFLCQDADQLETKDIAAATELRDRARKLLLRGRDYGIRGLEVSHPGVGKRLSENPRQAVGEFKKKENVPLMYWTAAAWGAAITISKNDPTIVADQVVVEALIDRALELDESYEFGALHSFLISYEPARQGSTVPMENRVKVHYDRALELSSGQIAGVFVAYAEAVSVQKQNRSEFETMLNRALAIDVNAKPEWRLQNLIMQGRAKWLLSRKSELFLE